MNGLRFVMSLQGRDTSADDGGTASAWLVVPCDCSLVGFVLSGWTVGVGTSLIVNEENLMPEISLPAGNYHSRVIDFDEFTGTDGQPLRLKKGDAVQVTLYLGSSCRGIRADAVFLEG